MVATCIYLHKEVKELLADINLAVIGDSIQRSVYKDLVCLLQSNRYLSKNELRKRGEMNFLGDDLAYGGKKEKQNDSVVYRECRIYVNTEVKTNCNYFFITRCFNSYVEEVLKELSGKCIDVVIMNSCLWDVHRYTGGKLKYEENLENLVKCIVRELPDVFFIWLTTPPVDISCKGGFLSNPQQDLVKIEEVKFCNEVARKVFTGANGIYGTFKIVDLESNFKYLEQERTNDGVHWNACAHRHMSNLILEEITKFYDVPRLLNNDTNVETEHNNSGFTDKQGIACQYNW